MNICTDATQQNYFDTMATFFTGITDPLNLDQLCNRPNPVYQYRRILEETEQLSGPNDRKTTSSGNDYWVESTSLMGD